MEITTYRELKNKDPFMFLTDQSFGWPCVPNELEKIINLDIRLKNSPVGFCAVENGKLAGFVGVLDIPTRTLSGKEITVGGITWVATNPNFAKRGICKILMERAHQYFLEKKYPFSFLNTMKTIIAYAIYLKMGYVKVEKVSSYTSAYRILKRDKIEKKPEKNLDQQTIFKIYQQFTKDRTGFVVRQKNFLKMFAERKRFEDKKSFQEKDGYALSSASSNVIRIQELISRNEWTYHKLLDQVESIAQDGVINRMITDHRFLETYRDRGYYIEQGDHRVLMVKKLADSDFEKTYGDAFHIGMLDLF